MEVDLYKWIEEKGRIQILGKYVFVYQKRNAMHLLLKKDSI